jgi:hypothetical protein
LFLYARHSYDSADCPDNSCEGGPADTRTLARTQAIVGGIGAGVGAALLGTGIALFYVEPSTSAQLTANVTPWSIALHGSF